MISSLDTESLTSDPITVEVMAFCPKVRECLRVSKHIDNAVVSFLIEDPISGRFSRLGVVEYTFISLLDGRTTVAEALAVTASKHGLDALDEQDAVSLCGWLVDAGLAHTHASQSGKRASENASKNREQQLASALNPMFQRMPLGSPTFLVAPLAKITASLLASRWILLVLALWIAATGIAVVGNAESFWKATRNVFASDNWMWLAATWLIVKVFHELGHAITCRVLGGRVGEAGIMWVLLVPMPYVEVTSSWAFPNKWHRILVASAGMMVETFLASIAFWMWMYSSDPLLQMHARNLIVSATITTLLFNLNPLMRFDGYYILSDFLELPNLSTNAARWLSYIRQRYWLGATVAQPTWPEGRVRWVAAYAVAALIWRILICVSLALAASSLFWGAGVLLSILAIAIWIGKPLTRLISNWSDPMRINHRYFAIITVSLVVVTVAVLLLPWQSRVLAPMVVAHEAPSEIRSRVRGFVREIHVEPGQLVRVDDLLVRLENRELEIDVQRLSAEIAQSRHRQRVLRRDQLLVELEVERASEIAMATRMQDLEKRLEGLNIRSDIDGMVVQSDLVDQVGTLVTEGKRLFTIADPARLKLVAMIGQDDAVTLRDRNEFDADVWIEGQGKVISTILFDRLSPRAVRDLAHPALASSLGGPLAVYANPQALNTSEQWQLVEPRVSAEALLDGSATNSIHLRSGQRGYVRLLLDRRCIGAILGEALFQWYRKSGGNLHISSR